MTETIISNNGNSAGALTWPIQTLIRALQSLDDSLRSNDRDLLEKAQDARLNMLQTQISHLFDKRREDLLVLTEIRAQLDVENPAQQALRSISAHLSSQGWTDPEDGRGWIPLVEEISRRLNAGAAESNAAKAAFAILNWLVTEGGWDKPEEATWNDALQQLMARLVPEPRPESVPPGE